MVKRAHEHQIKSKLSSAIMRWPFIGWKKEDRTRFTCLKSNFGDRMQESPHNKCTHYTCSMGMWYGGKWGQRRQRGLSTFISCVVGVVVCIYYFIFGWRHIHTHARMHNTFCCLVAEHFCPSCSLSLSGTQFSYGSYTHMPINTLYMYAHFTWI